MGGRAWKPSGRYNLVVLQAGEGHVAGCWEGLVFILFDKHIIVFVVGRHSCALNFSGKELIFMKQSSRLQHKIGGGPWE